MVISFYIVVLDQKKTFDYISTDFLWEVLKIHHFPDNFMNTMKCLYIKSTVPVNVNGSSAEPLEVRRGVTPFECSPIRFICKPINTENPK